MDKGSPAGTNDRELAVTASPLSVGEALRLVRTLLVLRRSSVLLRCRPRLGSRPRGRSVVLLGRGALLRSRALRRSTALLGGRPLLRSRRGTFRHCALLRSNPLLGRRALLLLRH